MWSLLGGEGIGFPAVKEAVCTKLNFETGECSSLETLTGALGFFSYSFSISAYQ